MELDDEDKIDHSLEIGGKRNTPDYPWGLRVCLTEKEIEKLGLDHSVEVGDLIDMRCFGTVTSVSMNKTGDGTTCRVEIQIEKMAVESEMDEDES